MLYLFGLPALTFPQFSGDLRSWTVRLSLVQNQRYAIARAAVKMYFRHLFALYEEELHRRVRGVALNLNHQTIAHRTPWSFPKIVVMVRLRAFKNALTS